MFDNKLNILLIEDNPGDALLINEFLLEAYSDKYCLEHATCLSDGLQILEKNEYDIILLDLGLPDSSGLNSIGLINSKAGSTPITILSGLEDEQTALKALQQGAQDYFIKGQIDSRIFTRAVRYAIERKKTEEKLRENEEYYYSLFENNRSIMILIDLESGAIFDSNASACEFYGYTRNEFRELSISDINMLSQNEISEKMSEAFSYNATGFQFRHRLKNGEIRDVEVHSGPIRRGSRKLLYSIVHDVTERKRMEEKINRINEQLELMVEERTADLKHANESLQIEIVKRSLAENALKQSEVKYKTVIDFTQDWETWIGPSGEYIYISPSCETISGYSDMEFFDDPDLTLKICHPDDKMIFANHIDQIMKKDRQNCAIDFRIFTKSGELKWIGHRCQPVYDSNGIWLGRRGSNRDITENKRAEDELQLLYTITQSISETGNFDDAMNRALQKICEATGWNIGEIWIPDKENTALSLRAGYCCKNEKLKKFIEESKLIQFSPSIGMPGLTWSSKEPLWINDISKDLCFFRTENAKKAGLKTAISLPVFSGDAVVAVFNFFLTESREKNEQDIRLFTGIASQMGSVIHSRLAEEKILHSEELYRKEKELSELKSRFVSMISHEYRTPLTAILSSTELLELYGHKWTEEKKREHIEKIKNSVNYMTEMLKDVLLINRAEAGRLEFDPDDLELVSYCRNLTSEIQVIAGNKLTIEFTSNVDSLHSFMDKKLLQYIFNNLLINAVNYSVDGGKIIFAFFAGEEHLTFNVKDNGIGIPDDDKQRLFEQFFRGKNTTNIPGTGLGLSIVKRCVDLHNGKIDFESEVGRGTSFTIVIPRTGSQSNINNLNY